MMNEKTLTQSQETEKTFRDPLLESVGLITKWFDREDDLPGWAPVDMIFSPQGSVPYRSETELASIRQESRWLAQSHPFAISAIENRCNYVVGTGHMYKVRAKPGYAIDASTLDDVQREVLDFVERNQWHHRQLENQRRLDRDGEVFLRLFIEDGGLVVRFVEPEYVAQPPGRTDAPYGIETLPHDVETVQGYWVLREPGRPGSFERVPASDIQHRKANVDLTMPRGVPTLYAVRHNLRRSWKLLRNMSTVASVQSAIAIVRRHTGATTASLQQYVANLASMQRVDASGQVKTYQHYPPGAIVDTPPGVEYTFPATGIDVAKYVEALQAELRAIAARLAMPEFMLSADASNANYSSTMVAEGPAVKMFERLQSEMIWHDYRIINRALEAAEAAGRLPEGVSALIEIDAEAPIVLSRDRLKEAQADQILLSMGVVSAQTVAARHGFTYDQEKDLIMQDTE